MWTFETELSLVVPRTPTIRTFRFPVRVPGFRYRPGQFQFVDIRNDKGQELEHHLTISSSPTEKGYVEFTKRLTQSEFSQRLGAMKPGDWARIQAPAGDFTLPARPRKVAFLSGGIGITPLRSMLRYVADRALPFDIVFLYGNTAIEEIAFREELDDIARSQKGVRVVHVLSSSQVPPGWPGRTGPISSSVVREEVPDYGERLFYISGPPRMVLALEAELNKLGVADRQIKRDSFTGYD